MKMKLTSDELAKKRSSEEGNLLKIDEDFVHSHWLAWKKNFTKSVLADFTIKKLNRVLTVVCHMHPTES